MPLVSHQEHFPFPNSLLIILICVALFSLSQVSDEEVGFLTQGDAQSEEVVLSLWHVGLKLLVVTDGEKGCRYFTKVCHFVS